MISFAGNARLYAAAYHRIWISFFRVLVSLTLVMFSVEPAALGSTAVLPIYGRRVYTSRPGTCQGFVHPTTGRTPLPSHQSEPSANDRQSWQQWRHTPGADPSDQRIQFSFQAKIHCRMCRDRRVFHWPECFWCR